MKIFIVVGCQRSGTTLTGQFLGAHPQSFLIDETDGLYSWFDKWTSTGQNLDEIHTQTIRSAAKKYTDDRSHFNNFDDLNGMNLVLKAPNLTYRIQELSALRIKPVVIFPVRDIRSVVASMTKLSNIPMVENQVRFIEGTPGLAERFEEELKLLSDALVPRHIKQAAIWKIKTEYYKIYLESTLDTIVFRYEDFVVNPWKIGQEISEHCGLELAIDQVNFPNVLTGNGPGNTLRNRRIDADSLEKWRGELTELQVADILRVGSELMVKLGYNIYSA